MEQINIYQFLGKVNDPIYVKILNLKEGETVDLGGVNVTLNSNGLYELESDNHHECFRTKKQLYDGVAKLISLKALA